MKHVRVSRIIDIEDKKKWIEKRDYFFVFMLEWTFESQFIYHLNNE